MPDPPMSSATAFGRETVHGPADYPRALGPALQTCPDIGLGVVVNAEALGTCLFECVGQHVERFTFGAEVSGDVGFGVGGGRDGVDPVRFPATGESDVAGLSVELIAAEQQGVVTRGGPGPCGW